MNTSFERPYKPVDLNTSLTQGFPIPSLAEKLDRGNIQYVRAIIADVSPRG